MAGSSDSDVMEDIASLNVAPNPGFELRRDDQYGRWANVQIKIQKIIDPIKLYSLKTWNFNTFQHYNYTIL